jgi:3D (Asp-Asp-Asp) domain-containing protein
MQISSVTDPAITSLSRSPNEKVLETHGAAAYAETHNGMTYTATINVSANGYEAAIPTVPGATTSGTTVKQVENKLSQLISIFA